MSVIKDLGSRIFQKTQPTEPAQKPAAETPAAKPNVVQQNATVRQYAGESSFDTHSAKTSTEGAQAPASPQALNPQSVEAANRDYDKYKNSGAPTTRFFISMMEQHKNDPDYVAQLVNRAKESSPGVLDYMMGPLNGAFTKDSGGAYAGGFTDQDRQTIVDAVNTARSKGTLTDQEIRDRAATSPGWRDVAQRIGVTQVGIDPTTTAATDEVAKAQKAYNDADKDVKEKEERLAKELADFGPALTDEQRAAYIKAFKEDPKHKEAFQKQAKAAEALGEVLSKNRETLERAAVSDPRARQQLYDSLKAVASSETPKAALEFYKDISADPNSTLGQAFAQYKDIDKEILQPAVSGAAGQLMAENGGDPKKAFAELEKLVGPILEAKEKYLTPGSEAKAGLKETKEAWAALSEAAKGNYSHLNKLAEDWKKVGEVNGLAKGLASASLVFAAAGVVGDAKGGLDEFQKGEYVKAIESFAKAGEKGLEIVAGATKALADAGKLAQYGNKALKFADFAARLAPGLGLIANSAAFVDHLSDAAKTKNAGYAVAALGDAIGVLGSAVELVPGGQPVGAVFSGIGTVISAGGEIFGNFLEKKAFEDEQKRFLEAAGVPADLRQKLFEANGDRVRELANDLRLSPTQIQDLTRMYPNLLEGTGRGVVLDNFKKMVKDLGLNPDNVYGIFKSIGEGTGNNPAALEIFFSRLSRDLYPKNGQEWLAAINQIATDPANHEDLRKVFGNVDQYLKSLQHGPPAPTA